MSKFSSKGVRLKYTKKRCLNDRQGLFLNQNNQRVLIHNSIQGWIDEDPELIYDHVYRNVACKLKRLELSKKAVEYLKKKLDEVNPKLVFNITLRGVIKSK